MSRSLPPIPPMMDWEAFRRYGHQLIDFIADYHTKYCGYGADTAATSAVKPGELSRKFAPFVASHANEAPPAPVGFDEVLEEIRGTVVPATLHWQHPKFLAFFPCMASPPALLGEIAAQCFNTPGFTWEANPPATEMEVAATDALSGAMRMPAKFLWSSGEGGCVLQQTATEGLLVTMIAARERAMTYYGHRDLQRFVVYYSDQSHFAVEKCAKILGIRERRVLRSVFDDDLENYTLDVNRVRATIAEDVARGLCPMYFSANFGATGCCSIDPLVELGLICRSAHMWYNIDAAYAGAIRLLPERREDLPTAALEAADSVLINGSKWMSMLFNTSLMFFSSRAAVTPHLNATGQYLTQPSSSVDLKDYQLGLGRPFRSLKVWTTLRLLGVDGIASSIRRHTALAAYVDEKLRSRGEFFRVVTRTKFGLVVFTLRDAPAERVDRFVREVGEGGWVILATTLGGVRCVRLSLSHPALQWEDMDRLVERFVDVAQRV